jgi:hypothetical protein
MCKVLRKVSDWNPRIRAIDAIKHPILIDRPMIVNIIGMRVLKLANDKRKYVIPNQNIIDYKAQKDTCEYLHLCVHSL